jgi:UDP-GlcNAc3NAcA epimerase
MKILTVVGARPQFVKAAVVSRAIQEYNQENPQGKIQEIIVHTGQHYDANMSDVFFDEMHIPKPGYHLGVGGSSHGAMTGNMLAKLEEVMLSEKPDVVLVYGDTNSTLAGSLAAVKLHIPVAHVEAGLRSFNMRMPEEVNRILTDRISTWLFCPTETAVNNLEREGYLQENFSAAGLGPQVNNVGDVMYDAVLYYQKIAKPTQQTADLLEKYKEGFYLSTIHRAENTDDPSRLENIITSLNNISKVTPVILPVHPRTRKLLENSSLPMSNLVIIDPVGYFDMITLLANCNGVFTDSGGLQKEAFFFAKPCVTLRDETEWVELINNGFNVLVGAQPEKIKVAEEEIKKQKKDYSKALYGTGDAGKKIIQLILQG